MRPSPFSPAPRRAPALRRILRLPRCRALALSGALAVLSLVAAACGGENGSGASPATGSGAATVEPVATSDFMTTRPGAGIAAAGGNLRAIGGGGNPCGQPGSGDPITISYIGANLAELDAIGLEALVIEEPGLIIDAYTNEVNFNGGINGRCVEFIPHLWSLEDPAGSFTQICTELPAQQPIVYFALRVYDPTLQCATIGAQIPTIGLFTSPPASTFELTGDRLFVDDGSVERLLAVSLDVALSSGVISADDPIGLLHGAPDMPASVAIIEGFGLNNVAAVHVPSEFADLQLLLQEKQVRLLEEGLTGEEQAEAQRNLAALPPELAELYGQIEQFFLAAANRFKDAGVTAVATTADWIDMRRLMRAAELIDWTPTWVANDIQPATVVLADVPKRQAENLVLVSNRRAAGDEVPELDQGCITLRNTASTADPFSHRLHTDAWTLITATCDYLDVAFSAMTRAQGEITADAFVEALLNTRYDTGYGGLITFASGNLSGAERFRVLQADPECVLDFWGCMRSITDWLLPADPAGGSAG